MIIFNDMYGTLLSLAPAYLSSVSQYLPKMTNLLTQLASGAQVSIHPIEPPRPSLHDVIRATDAITLHISSNLNEVISLMKASNEDAALLKQHVNVFIPLIEKQKEQVASSKK